MNPIDELEQKIRHLPVPVTDVTDQRILSDALAAWDRSQTTQSQSTQVDATQTSVWRIVMRSKWTRLVAAVLVVAALGTVLFHRQLTAAAYALEQTLEANLGLRFLHVRCEPAGSGISEARAQFGDDGTLLRAKLIFPKTEDGAKEVSWQADKAEVWFKQKGHVLVLRDKNAAERIAQEMLALDPKRLAEQIHAAEAQGAATIKTREPAEKGAPIVLEVTYADAPDRREELVIDPETKLVREFKKYRQGNGKDKLVGRFEFLDYNQEIPPEQFALNVPPEVMRIDWTTQQVGLAKGDLSDEEIATKIAREFFEALIAKDYEKAGSILSGMPASRMEEAFGTTEFLKIVSIGKPTPHPDARTKFLRVPCEVEIRVEGKTQTKTFTPLIRALEDGSDRWSIGGGI